MNNCRYKIRHFTRAIELGTSDLSIYVQDMRFKNFVRIIMAQRKIQTNTNDY